MEKKKQEAFNEIISLDEKNKKLIIKKIEKYKIKDESKCPYCKSSKIIKNGTERNKHGEKKQRYVCNNCKRSFRNSTRTFSQKMRKPEKWIKFLENILKGLSLRKISEEIGGISHVSLFKWKKRLLNILDEIKIDDFLKNIREEH